MLNGERKSGAVGICQTAPDHSSPRRLSLRKLLSSRACVRFAGWLEHISTIVFGNVGAAKVCGKQFCRSSVTQAFTRPAIERMLYGSNLSVREAANRPRLGTIQTQQPNRVFDRAFFPTVVGSTEIRARRKRAIDMSVESIFRTVIVSDGFSQRGRKSLERTDRLTAELLGCSAG